MNLFKTICLMATAASASFAANPAAAAIYAFDLSGGKTASFTIDTAATPAFSSTGIFGSQISYDNVLGIFVGSTQTASIGFGTSIFAQLNVSGTTLGFTQYGGPDLFSFVNNVPVFNLGTFNLSSLTSGPATITIRAATIGSAVPEPSTWALMLLGFGMVGFAARVRRKQTRVVFAG